MLRGLDWYRETAKVRPEQWFTTLHDRPRETPIHGIIRRAAAPDPDALCPVYVVSADITPADTDVRKLMVR